MIIFQQGDWGINRSEIVNADPMCLRHMGCGNAEGTQYGCCACSGACWKCKAKAPDEIKGFLALVRWKR